MTVTESRPTPDPRRDAPAFGTGPNPIETALSANEGTANPVPNSDPADPIDPADAEWTRQATWHLRKIARLEDQKFATIQSFDAEIERLERRRDEEIIMFDRRLEWHRAPLRQLHRALLTEDPARKTIVLPYGKLTSRTPATPTVRVQDREAFTAWAHVNAPHLLAVSFTPDRKHIAAQIGDTMQPVAQPAAGESVPVVTADGQIVPGLAVGLDDTTFGIKLDGEV